MEPETTVADTLDAALWLMKRRHGEAFQVWWDSHDETPESVDEDRFLSEYCGKHKSLAHWCEEDMREWGSPVFDLPEDLRQYFDFQDYAEDMQLNGEIWSVQTGFDSVYVFRPSED